MNPRHLLDQAERLATAGRGRPRQSDLRRAMSTTYYALFHLLTQAGASSVVRLPAARTLVARQFDHKTMKSACRLFAGGRLPDPLPGFIPDPIPPEVVFVAELFQTLQERRHTADYDSSTTADLTRADVVNYLARTRQAFEGWEAVQATPAAELFMLALLFHPLVR